MGEKMATLFKKYVLLAYGVAFQAFGVALMYYSEMGSAPAAVFNEGLHLTLGVTVGVGNYITSTVLIILAFIIDRRHISVATFIMAFWTGFLMDVAMELLGYFVPEVLTEFDKWLFLFLSSIVICIGVGFVIAADAGTAPYEAFALPVSEKIHIPYKYLCIIINVIFVIAGWLLGGKVGWCTLIFGTMSGFIISYTTKVATRTVTSWLGLSGLAVD